MKGKIYLFLLGFISCFLIFLVGFVLFYNYIVKSQMEFFDNDLKVERKISNYEISNFEKLQPEYFVDLKSQQKIELNEVDEDIIFINIWATWCGPCIAEMPYFEEFIESINNDKIKFLFISDESKIKISNFVTEKKFRLPFYKVDSLNNSFFNHKSIPTNYIIDRRTNLVYKFTGSSNWNNSLYLNFLNTVIE